MALTPVSYTDTYARSFDVVNRGFSGYNARWTLIALRQLLPPPAQQQQRIRLFTLWLGANDCVAPGSVQHVPLVDFRADMAALVALMRERAPGTPVILITPGPVQVERWNVGREARNRSNAQVEQYVQAVRELGEAEHVPVVDAYEALWAAAGSRDEAALERFYTDGLHFAAPGYEVGHFW
jgi:lysophospholipase L1-like esterase